MNPIVRQILWIAVAAGGLALTVMSELFRKSERAYKIVGVYVRFLGISICFISIILAPFDSQPRIEGILGFSFRIAGIVLTAVGMVLMIVPAKRLLKAHGPELIPRELVTDGLHSKVRNPQYTGIILSTIGWNLVWRAIYSFFIITPMVFLGLLAVVKFWEEPMLTKLFGDKYLDYRKRVPMFFPSSMIIVLAALVTVMIAFIVAGLIPVT